MSLRQFQKQGRVVLSGKYRETHDIREDAYWGEYCFTTVYIGRKAIFRRGIKHALRKARKDFLKMESGHLRYDRLNTS